jgi:regulator of nucleoside diphosphate kinase
MNRPIIITAEDLKRLNKRIADQREFGQVRNEASLASLEKELKRAEVVAPEEIPPHTITMNARFTVLDLDTEEEDTYALVYPEDADYLENKISILAPMGTAMIGYREGDEIQWEVPDGTLRLKVLKIIFQPEAAGRYDL